MIRGLPERLKENRKRYGYSQKQVAAKLGLSPSIVSGYKRGNEHPVQRCSCHFLICIIAAWIIWLENKRKNSLVYWIQAG